MSSEQLSLEAVPVLLVSLIITLVVGYATRPSRPVVVGAALAGALVVLLNIVCDVVAFALGFWHYPFTTHAYAPLWAYIAQDTVWGMAVAMIGWRVQQRFGVKGLVLFVVALSGAGAGRDFAYATVTHVIVFGPGTAPIAADWVCWLILLSIAQLTRCVVQARMSGGSVSTSGAHRGEPGVFGIMRCLRVPNISLHPTATTATRNGRVSA